LHRVLSDAELAAHEGVAVAEVAAVLAAARARLLEVRDRRLRPHRDDKILAAWNGLMLGALARGARVLERADLAAAAGGFVKFLERELWDGQRLWRSWRAGRWSVPAFAADHACIVHGLLEWHAAGGGEAALRFAAAVQEAMDRECWDDVRHGYVMRCEAAGVPLMVLKDDHDGAEPAANHLAADNLLRLAVLLDRPALAARADAVLRGAAAGMTAHPFAAPVLLGALDLRERGVVKIEVRGEPEAELAELLRSTYLPRAVWARGTGGGGEVMVCRGGTCQPPVRTAAEWRALPMQ
jgi:hypothetical protein